MSKRASVNDRLARLLESPHLAQVVPRLAPEVLHQLIQHRGLEACVALVSAATPAQLASILDLDLWHATTAGADQFDAHRFGVWLETLMDEGEAAAVRVVTAMDQRLAIAGLSRYVHVFDPGALPSRASSEDDLEGVDAPASGDLECEVGGYHLRARTPHAWDAIMGLLVTLATDGPDSFHALMQGCRRLSNSTPEADGFHDLLLAPEQWLHDVSLDREDRRTQQGYLSTGDARAFLQMARQSRPFRPDGSSEINAIAAAYFRTLDEARESAGERGGVEGSAEPAVDGHAQESIEAVVDLLAEAGITPARPRALLGPAAADVASLVPIEPLMEFIQDTDQSAYFARSRELSFLANALVAGCSVHSRPFTVQEAWNAAVGICNLGLEVWLAQSSGNGVPDACLVDHDLVSAFEAGWKLLHEDVSMFVAGRLIAALADLRSVDTATARDLYVLRRELERNCDRGTPWCARDALDPIAILDMLSWASLRGLLSECPVWPEALAAILGGHARAVSETGFECFATRAQILRVREFAERLRDVLLA